MLKNETIQKRKSIRKYDPSKLDDATLEKVRTQITKLRPLYPDIAYSIQFADDVRRALGINAPHYLLLYSEQKDGANMNIGFIGQQLDLFFSEQGLGACWVGMAKTELADEQGLPFVIAIAFGKPAEPLHRTHAEFKRKPLSEISEGADHRLEAARLAPSGINAQRWYFIATDGKIHCYRKKPNAVLGRVAGALGEIDLGIALWHIASESVNFKFVTEENPPERKGFIYAGTVEG